MFRQNRAFIPPTLLASGSGDDTAPFGPEGANFNLIIGNAAIDPISGSVPHRAYLCQICLVE